MKGPTVIFTLVLGVIVLMFKPELALLVAIATVLQVVG